MALRPVLLISIAALSVTKARQLHQSGQVCCSPYSSNPVVSGVAFYQTNSQGCNEVEQRLEVPAYESKDGTLCLAVVYATCERIAQVSGYPKCDVETAQSVDAGVAEILKGGAASTQQSTQDLCLQCGASCQALDTIPQTCQSCCAAADCSCV